MKHPCPLVDFLDRFSRIFFRLFYRSLRDLDTFFSDLDTFLSNLDSIS